MASLRLALIASLLITSSAFADGEGKVGGNYLKYTDSNDTTYNGWAMVDNYNKLAPYRLGLLMYGQFEQFPESAGLYGEIKPYIAKDRWKVDLQYVHDAWRNERYGAFTGHNRIGVGFEYKLWD